MNPDIIPKAGDFIVQYEGESWEEAVEAHCGSFFTSKEEALNLIGEFERNRKFKIVDYTQKVIYEGII